MNLPDPLYHPLVPSIEDLLEYSNSLEWEDNHISFDWADNEIKNYQLGYVRIGLVAQKIQRYKLYLKAGFETFREYCEKGLGKCHWQINQLIKSAKVVLKLLSAGFKTLPQNESQARHLIKLSENELFNKWEEVISSAPPHRLTATHVEAIVRGEMADCQPSRQLKVPQEIYGQLAEKAAAAGLKPAELLKKLVEAYDPPLPAEQEQEQEAIAPEEEEKAIAPITQEQLTHWAQDLQNLLLERFGYQVKIRQPEAVRKTLNQGIP